MILLTMAKGALGFLRSPKVLAGLLISAVIAGAFYSAYSRGYESGYTTAKTNITDQYEEALGILEVTKDNILSEQRIRFRNHLRRLNADAQIAQFNLQQQIIENNQLKKLQRERSPELVTILSECKVSPEEYQDMLNLYKLL